MKKRFFITVLTLFFVLCIASLNFAQVKGQIFTKEDADKQFGSVLFSVKMSADELQSYLDRTSDDIMFRITDNKVVILDNTRKVLNIDNYKVEEDEQFKVFSVLIVKELLIKGGNSTVNIEQRKDVLSITNGEFTLEMGAICPPWCGEIDYANFKSN